MKTILIPTDFSQNSRHTLSYVLGLFQEVQEPCRILLVNTFKVHQTDPRQVIATNDELKMKSKENLERAKTEALGLITNSRITVETVSSMGSLDNVIHQILRQEKIDLVAMGEGSGKHNQAVASMLKDEQCPLLVTFIK